MLSAACAAAFWGWLNPGSVAGWVVAVLAGAGAVMLAVWVRLALIQP